MQCKYCSGIVPDNSVFCNICGERIARKKNSHQKAEQASVPKPSRLKDGTYSAQLMVDGKRVRVKGSTEREYYANARAMKEGLIEAKKTPNKKILSVAIDEYIASRSSAVSPSTIQTYKKKKRLYFTDLMQKNIYTLTKDDLLRDITKMIEEPGAKGKPLSSKTVKDAYSFITSVLTFQKINLEEVPLPKVYPSGYGVLTEEEQGRLLKALRGNPCELEILLALWLGLRRSEIIALEKSDFDFEHECVSVTKALVRNDEGEYVSKGTKTEKSTRKIACPSYILELVRLRPSGRIYNYDANYILKCLHKVCEANGLPAVRLHDLRHINASVGLMLGVPDKYMMERGGWSGIETMKYRYQHTYDAAKVETDRTMNNYFENLLTGDKKEPDASRRK